MCNQFVKLVTKFVAIRDMVEQLDFFPEQAEHSKKAKRERRKKWPVNPGEIRRKRRKADLLKLARYSRDYVSSLVDKSGSKEKKK